jgi:putative transposase
MGKLLHRIAPGSTYFVTTKTWEGRSLFQVMELAQTLIGCLFKYRDQGAYLLHEFAVMPNHLHLLLTPSEATTLEKAMQLIKGGSSHEIHLRQGHRMQIWQPGFHDWTVRDAADYQAKKNYIWMNPVTAHLVERPEDWVFGSSSGKFKMDPMSESLASGAKAHSTGGG